MSGAAFLDRHYLLLRRLHSLTGVVPIGAFLVPHLLTNSSIVWGRWLNPSRYGDAGVETFQHEVNFIHSLPALVLLEFGLIWLPIAFHAILGIVFARTGRFNVSRYPSVGNWRYTLQRLTGYVGLLFIVLHVTSLRFDWDWWGLTPGFDAERAASSTAEHFQRGAWGVPFAVALYLTGMLSLVYHFANGLWTAAITWGLTVRVPAQRRWGQVCAATGLLLAAAGVAAVVGFSLLNPESAARVEDLMVEGH